MQASPLPESQAPFKWFTSVLLRVLSLVVIVGVLVVVLHSLSGENGTAATAALTPKLGERDPAEKAAPATGTPPRVVYAGPSPIPPRPPSPAAEAPPRTPEPAPGATPLAQQAPGLPAAAMAFASGAPAAVAPPLPVRTASIEAKPAIPASPPPPARAASVEAKPERAAAAASGLVDLNTASVEALNGLNGAGMIGRTIVRNRPYSSPEDLLKKRILSRSAYERIKDQITVQ